MEGNFLKILNLWSRLNDNNSCYLVRFDKEATELLDLYSQTELNEEKLEKLNKEFLEFKGNEYKDFEKGILYKEFIE
ncbi:hypothetical protein ACFLS9_10750, partial [Bacteroidota bacterium]